MNLFTFKYGKGKLKIQVWLQVNLIVLKHYGKMNIKDKKEQTEKRNKTD